jgi:hypothetical protein
MRDTHLASFVARDRGESTYLRHLVRKRGVKSLTDDSRAFVYGKERSVAFVPDFGK